MPVRNIVNGQSVSEEKIERAKQLRREMTPAERLIWERVRANRLHGLSFRRQQIIDGFIVDFYCHSVAVIVEIDGPVHDERERFDKGRENILTRRGFRVLRFKNEEVQNDLDGVVGKIAAACGCRKPLPPAPSPKRGGGEVG